jgi:hypothetical protein
MHVGDPDVLTGGRADDRGDEPGALPPLGVGVPAGPRPAGCRSGERYQVIRSAPGHSMSGVSAPSR